MNEQTKFSPAAMTILMAATFVFVLDFFIVAVSIPATQAELGASDGDVQLIVTAYAIAIASTLIIGGRLGDLYGRRRLLLVGLSLFSLASVLCGLAPDPSLLIVGRALQGLGAGLFAPQILSLIAAAYEGEERQRAVTIYGLVLGLGAVSGQLIGGLLVHFDLFGLGWRSCYLVNVPVGIAAVALAPRLIAESRPQNGGRVDLLGAGLVAVTLAAVVLPLVEGRRQGWPAWTWVCLAAALLLALAFAARQRRLAAADGPPPLVHPELFRHRAFTVGLLVSVLFYVGMASFFVVLALYLQEGRGLDALGSGLVFTPLAAGYLLASIASQRLAPRLGRQVLAAGAVIRAGALLALALTVSAIGVGGSTAVLIPALFVDGLGMGLLTAPLIATVLSGMSPAHAGAASGVLSTAQQVGNSIGVAAVGVVYYGVLGGDGDFAAAFQTSLLCIAGVSLAVAALVQLLPGRAGVRVGADQARRSAACSSSIRKCSSIADQ